MSNELIIVLVVIFILAMVVQAYNTGWDAGHDAGHDHEGSGGHEPPPPEVPRLWK